ncbi:hypothetical protein ABWH96_16880 [Marivirga tractuosa]|uniref:hypothetical protein n=1 Tax=Marivirga tractuosa TaxID=1006 RepID=UPI0035D02586
MLKYSQIRNIVILIVLISACQKKELSKQDRLSGIWYYSVSIDSESDLPDTLFVSEYEFISDTSGLLYNYEIFTTTGISNKNLAIANNAPNQDSFLVDKSLSDLTIIPGHLLRPFHYKIERLDDTLIIRSQRDSTTETFYKWEH